MTDIKKTREHIKVNNKQVYRVETEGDVEGRTIKLLGYATGDPSDIEQFYGDKKYYSLSINPIELEVMDIDKETLEKKLTYLRLKKELKDLEDKLR